MLWRVEFCSYLSSSAMRFMVSYCFEANTGRTPETWDGACRGFPKHYPAVWRWNKSMLKAIRFEHVQSPDFSVRYAILPDYYYAYPWICVFEMVIRSQAPSCLAITARLICHVELTKTYCTSPMWLILTVPSYCVAVVVFTDCAHCM